MDIRFIIICKLQRSCDIDVFRIAHLLLHEAKQLLIIHREISILLRKKKAFVRNNGKVNIHRLVGKILLINRSESIRGMSKRIRIQRIFQLRSVSVLHIDSVIVELAKHIIGRNRLQPAKRIPKRKLVLCIVLKVLHKASVRNCRTGKLRELRELSSFTVGEFLFRRKPGCKRQPCINKADHGSAEDAPLLFSFPFFRKASHSSECSLLNAPSEFSL